MIAVIDYGLGNVCSIQNRLRHIGEIAIIMSNRADIESADKLILPGVGRFDEGMRNLKESGLCDIIKEETQKGKMLLGICLVLFYCTR